MKKVMLLATGGTIAAREGQDGLAPDLAARALLEGLGAMADDFTFESRDVFNLDSSNIQPEQWQLLAREVYDALPRCDGVLITHGTDTMAYTAAALSFMLRDLKKPVVLTGSQIPLGAPLSDAGTNLQTALAAIGAGMRGVFVAFDRNVINGCRAVKISTMDFDAFASVNAAVMARVFADGLRVYNNSTAAAEPSGPAELREALCPDVFLLKLIPGTSPRIFGALGERGYRGVVIEAFGAGGMHYLGRDLLEPIKQLGDAGVAVVVCSQCLYDRSELGLYEVGRRILSAGAVSAIDMTSEAAVTKLMWALGQTNNKAAAIELFRENLVGEIEQASGE